MKGGYTAVALALALLAPALATAHGNHGAAPIAIEDFEVVTADGSTVKGKLAYPTDRAPTQLVVFAHGRGQTVVGAWMGHIAETAREGVAVVAVDFRDNLGFPTMWGAEDTNAAALKAFGLFPSVTRVHLVGVSMGGAISGVAAAEKPLRPDGSPLYDTWITIEGVSNVFETYYAARAIGDPAAAGMERDAGGKAEEVPLEYARRSPAMRAHDLAYLEGVFLVHALNDGTVPYDQSVELAAALRGVGLPVEFATVLREKPGQDEGTTGTWRISNAAGQADPSETSGLHLAGHAWEGDRGSTVMTVGLERLFALLEGDAIRTGASVHDASASFGARARV
ncbi:MAG TPA: alpha/beta fold hydrolase [Candidatus Thermoplasmatota archaeon]|nr:alpha/beta fold hydrolase [Candidatus Thermoplasmatota archaeon]